MSEHVHGVSCLTTRGQMYYADQRQDGVSHEIAMKDAIHSYGIQRGPRRDLRQKRHRTYRGGWVAPLQGAQFAGLVDAVGPDAPGDTTTGGETSGDAGTGTP